MPYQADDNEQEILKYWQDKQVFEKSVNERPENKPYVFYDGPPFATGLPHYGHILSSVIKDLVPRYWTMKGYRVRRRWGWDCHGLPIENIVEKELKISGKKDIENELGVDVFNETCRSNVLKYIQEWKKMVDRIGRWIEFDNSYKTMDSTYMESVWWALKTIWDKGLIYEGRKMLMYCPRCETPVSKAEVAMDNSYEEITELSLTLRFKLVDEPDTYLLAWTTTPWTLPANMFVAVGPEIEYVKVKYNNEYYIVGKKMLEEVFAGKEYTVEQELNYKDLVGKRYEPLFPFYTDIKNGLQVYEFSLVSDEEGTGLIHMAVYGDQEELDFMNENDIELTIHLNPNGTFVEETDFLAGKYIKSEETERLIKEYLEKEGKLFDFGDYTHPYPHCWRCDTQLYYNPIVAWFINIQKIKDKLIKLNEKINWYPKHLKEGRFLNILETAPDWNISRNRYWATPLPFWKCGCGEMTCIGSVAELKAKAVNYAEVYKSDKIEEVDLHKHNMDKIKLKCDKCGKETKRIPEVIDCWVESGSMPFAEFHYPFENKEVFEDRFPGEYIGEYIGQVRAWFYYMHVMAVLLFDDVSFKNCVVTGNILNDKGEKLSKSKQNFTDPWKIIEDYGMDALRYYLTTSVVMQAEDLSFVDDKVREVYNKVINILWNVVTFYKMYDQDYDASVKAGDSNHVLDKWILARLQQLVAEVTKHMDNYDTVRAGRHIQQFIDDLSTWYVRRSRDRFKGEDEEEKKYALATLHEVLMTLAKLMAPFTPFIADKIYLELGGDKDSVHLEAWPQADKVDEKILTAMSQVRKVVEMGLSLRVEAGVKVRQVLGSLGVTGVKLSDQLQQVIAAELNVKTVTDSVETGWLSKEEGGITVGLDTEITDELKKEGLVREVTRTINQMRKEQKLTVQDSIVVAYSTDDDLLQAVFTDYVNEIRKAVLATELKQGSGEGKEIDGRKIKLQVIKN